MPPSGRPATPPVLLTGASVVLHDEVVQADLRIEDGVIAEIGGSAGSARGATPIDCVGCTILPGFVDLHTDNVERHVELRPGMFWPVERAVLAHDAELAGAGITTAFDAVTLGGGFADPTRQDCALRVIDVLNRAESVSEQLLRIDHFLHLRCELSDRELPAILQGIDGVRPRIVSLMNHTPGQRQWRDLDKFRIHYTRRYGLSERELTDLIAARRASEAEVVPANRRHAIAFAARTGALLASHDDTEPSDVDEAASIRCLLSEFPTTEAAAARAVGRGLAVVAGAPNLVRGASHSGNVSTVDLARGGHVQILSSDYCPSSLLQAVFMLSDRLDWPLETAARTTSSTPAHLLGLTDRGEIAIGRRADVVVVTHTSAGPVIRETWSRGMRVF